jgi:hypothetical protein
LTKPNLPPLNRHGVLLRDLGRGKIFRQAFRTAASLTACQRTTAKRSETGRTTKTILVDVRLKPTISLEFKRQEKQTIRREASETNKELNQWLKKNSNLRPRSICLPASAPLSSAA